MEVKANMQIDCKEKSLQHFIDEIKPDFLVYRVKTAYDLIDGGSYFLGISPTATVHETFITKNRNSFDAYERSNPIKDKLLIEIVESPVSRVGNVQIGICKDGVVFGLEVKDDWFKELEKIVKAIVVDELTNLNKKN